MCTAMLRNVVSIFRDILGDDSRALMLAIGSEPFPGGLRRRRPRRRVSAGSLTNLIDNAISFSPEGGTVTVHARAAGAEVEIVVEDEGPGIPADKLGGHLQALLFGPAADRHAPRQELRPGPEHLARDRCWRTPARSCAENRYDDGRRARAAKPDRGARFTVRLPMPACAQPEERPVADAT